MGRSVSVNNIVCLSPGERIMSRSLRVQMIAMLAVGGLIGYAIASRQPELAARSSAAETAHASDLLKSDLQRSPTVTDSSASVCLTESKSKGDLLAMADQPAKDVRVAQAGRTR